MWRTAPPSEDAILKIRSAFRIIYNPEMGEVKSKMAKIDRQTLELELRISVLEGESRTQQFYPSQRSLIFDTHFPFVSMHFDVAH